MSDWFLSFEAARAKKLAEEMMRAGDFFGDHKFGTKAQRPCNFFADTFWTRCVNCGHGHTYSRECMNTVMHCSICQKSYLACNIGDEPSSSTAGEKESQDGETEKRRKTVDDECNKKIKQNAEDYTQLQKKMGEMEKPIDDKLKQHEEFMHDVKPTHVQQPDSCSDHMKKAQGKITSTAVVIAMAENEYLSLLRDETIYHTLVDASRQAAEIQNVTDRWNDMPPALKTIRGAIFDKGRMLFAREAQQRQRKQELEGKILSIREIEALGIEIAELHQRKGTLTLEASDLEKKSEDSQQQLNTLEDQNTKRQQDHLVLMNQLEEKKSELESLKDQSASTTRKLRRKQKKLDSVVKDVRWIEDQIIEKEEEEREVKESYERGKTDLIRIKTELDYYKRHSEQIRKKINDDLLALNEANKSIVDISTQF
ncbi:unnamed protein product [Arabidopsis halleri]